MPPLRCPVSGSTEIERLIEFPEVPVLCNVLYDDRESARNAPRGDLDLAYAPQSGHLFNAAFDPDKIDYTSTYENSLHHSPRFQRYATSLADRLIDTYDVRTQTVLEIGCGNGEFLSLLCERGNNTGVGYDPSYERSSADPDQPFTVVPEAYSNEHAAHSADLICCRHVLEHLSDPLSFAGTLRRTIGDHTETVLYVEVPNALFILQNAVIWDLIYEHYSYFTPSSLAYLFRRAGFEVIRTGAAFGGQYLQIELRPVDSNGSSPETALPDTVQLGKQVQHFVRESAEMRSRWRHLFEKLGGQGESAVVWGAGSKGVMILNMIPETQKTVRHAVDINPRKQGRYIAGTGHPIVPPSHLTDDPPDTVFVMNANYQPEIRDRVHELGLSPNFEVATRSSTQGNP